MIIIGRLDENEFFDLVQQTAGLVRTGTVENQYFDGDTVGLNGHEVPDQREKEQLLRDTWAVAKEFLWDTEIPDEDALDYAALTVAGGLLYAHPFADGNGRTSRTLSYMIARGNGDEQELHNILAEQNGGGNWMVAPIPLAASGQTVFEGKQPNQIEWEWGEDDMLGGTITNSRYRSTILRKFIERFGELTKEQINKSSTPNDDGTFDLNGEDFIQNLTHDPEAGMTNARELLAIHREVRADFVQRYLKAMRLEGRINPQDIHPNQISLRDEDSEFARDRNRTIVKEVGKRAIDGLLTRAEIQLVRHRAYSRIRQEKAWGEDVAA